MARKIKHRKLDYIWGVTRISLGLIFLWAFFDKVFGLGFSTCRGEGGVIDVGCDSAWLQGGSPTEGFLRFGTKGPLAETFQSMAGNGFVDVLFMMGLLGIGVALVFGIGVRMAAYSGATLMLLMWSASAIWPEHHPFLDDHIIYALLLLGLSGVNNRQVLGLRSWWMKQEVVQNYPLLE
jgi:thiosulfate dehydrogenase (quinone) large subunit